MLLQVVAELLFFLAELDQLLVSEIGVADGTVRTHGSSDTLRLLRWVLQSRMAR